MLPTFASLTHMFVKFAAIETPDGEIEWPQLSSYKARTVDAAIQKYLPHFRQACGSLQWVVFGMYDLDLERWEVSHAGNGASQNLWMKTGREGGQEVLDREGMGAFRGVRQSLSTVQLRDMGEDQGMDSEPDSESYSMDSDAANDWSFDKYW